MVLSQYTLEFGEFQTDNVVEDAIKCVRLVKRVSLGHLSREENELADSLQEILFTDPEELGLPLRLQLFGVKDNHLAADLFGAHLLLLYLVLGIGHYFLELLCCDLIVATSE